MTGIRHIASQFVNCVSICHPLEHDLQGLYFVNLCDAMTYDG